MKPLGAGDPLRLGPYRILGVLGEGGMGKVYVGQDSAATLAAVKVLRPELAHDTNLAQRFVREAQAAQAVRSKGVANVLGAWTEGGRPWIASEFLAGLTLDQAVGAYGPLDEPALRALAATLASTLADIHAAGFIHRDLKPPNIVLTSTGPRIIDFGIARPEHGLTLTTTGQVPVTPGYGAPEQVLGQRVAPSADVFSLGAVLVYAAGGRRAFEGSHVAAVQYEVVHGEPRLDGVPEQVRQLIVPCLAKDSAWRPTPAQIAGAFGPPKNAERAWTRGALAADIKEREGAARQLTTQVTTPAGSEGLSRRRLLTVLGTGAAVLAAGGGSAAWWLGSRTDKADPFDIPPAVKRPTAKLDTVNRLVAFSGPKSLWAEDDVDTDSPRLLPVRDVLVFGKVDAGIVAYDVVRGIQRWGAPHMRVKSSYLSLSDRLVAAADGEGVLHTFVPSTGEAKWSCKAAEAELLLAADDTAVYVLTKDGRLRSIRRSDARVRWTANLPKEIVNGKVRARPGIGSGRLVLTTEDSHVCAVRTSDGRKVWTHTSPESANVFPAVYGDTVYVNGKTLDAKRLSDGKTLWSAKLYDWETNWQEWGPPDATADAIYVNAGIYTRCLDPKGGAERWSTSLSVSAANRAVRQGNGIWTVEEFAGGSARGVVLRTVYEDSGKNAWTYSFDYTQRHTLIGDGNRFFIQNADTVHALSVF
ncbi:protein kinase [Streptomyces sp. NPDC102467]|uniref:protein kinase domain-containing protein n=1 Tax=Streptomyces sp. NPDC102467 TaxID=3366179 RepID=UPI00381A8F61